MEANMSTDKRPKLVYAGTRKEVHIGDVARDFRGDAVIIVAFSPPHKSNSTGKVCVRDYGHDIEREVYVSVIGATWIDRDDQ
jgi:hypothetical protein